MNLKRLWATTATIFALSVLDPRSSGVWAATRAMCPEGWEWNRNSLGQDPCVVVSALDAVCYGKSTYVVPQITGVNDTYAPPNSSLEVKCDCDTVMYNLWTACASCQDGLIYSWTKWIAECDNGIAEAKYLHDIPQGTAIPRWAFYDVTTFKNQTYDDSIAKRFGRDPEVTSGPISMASPSSPTSGPTNTNGSDGKTNTRVIIGSVVGGIVVAAGVVVFIEQMGSA